MRTRVHAPGTSSLTCTRHLPGLGQPTHTRAIRSRTATRSPFSFFFGNAPSAFAIPDSAKLAQNAHTAFPKSTHFRNPSHPSCVSTFHPPGLLLGTLSFSSPSPGSGPTLARPARRLRPSGAAPSGHVPDPLAGQPHLPDSPRASQPPPRRGLALARAASICLRVRPALFPLARRLASASHPRMVLGMTPARCG